MSSSTTYSTPPKAYFTWESVSSLSYVVISWTGNTIATSGDYSSGNIYLPTTTYTTSDLSFNTLYSFALTPYNSDETSGAANVIYIDTTPAKTGVYATYSNSSSVKLQWYGTFSYAKVSRSVDNLDYEDISSAVLQNTYIDADLSGNTPYKYYVTTYSGTYPTGTVKNTSQEYYVTTEVQSPTDVSINFYDISGITLSFTEPKNKYSAYSYYSAVALDSSDIAHTTVGLSSPLTISNLVAGGIYRCYVRVTLDYSNNLVGKSSILTQKLKSNAYTNISLINGNTYVVGTNRIFVFNTSSTGIYSGTTNALNPSGMLQFDTNTSTTMTILAVGGGGGGGGGAPGRPCGGGGAGGLIYTSRNVTSSNNVYMTIGRGGGSTSNGGSTYVYFTDKVAGGSLDASGGGYGNWAIGAGSGGSGGGTEHPTTNVGLGISGLGYRGGYGVDSTSAGGGGGAGGIGGNGTYVTATTTATGGNGGDGLPYSITGTTVYYAAGGGGAANATVNISGKGGKGGGGDGVVGYFSGNGNNATGYGCGGGGAVQSYSGGSGSDGVVIVSIPLASISTLYNYVDDSSGLTFWYNFNSYITFESVSNSILGSHYGSLLLDSSSNFSSGGNSVSFTGSNAYISLTKTIPIGYGFSLCTWLKIPANTLAAGYNLIQIGSSSNYYFKLYVYSGNSSCLGFYSKSNSTVMINTYYPTNIFDNTWHHVAIVVKYITGGTATVTWYIDGSPITYTSVTTPIYFPTQTNYSTHYIGDNNNTSNNGTYYLKDVRYYNSNITSNAITTLYNESKSLAKITTYNAAIYDSSCIKLSWTGSKISKVFVYNFGNGRMSGSYSEIIISINDLIPYNRYYFSITPFDEYGVQGSPIFIDEITNYYKYYNLNKMISGVDGRFGCSVASSTSQLFYIGSTEIGYVSGTSYSTKTVIASNSSTGYTNMAVTSDGTRVVVVKQGNPSYVIHYTYNGSTWSSATQGLPGEYITNDGNNGIIGQLAISSDGTYVVYCMYNNDPKVLYSTWNGTKYTGLTRISGSFGAQWYSISLTNDGTKLAASLNDGTTYQASWNGSSYGTLTKMFGSLNLQDFKCLKMDNELKRFIVTWSRFGSSAFGIGAYDVFTSSFSIIQTFNTTPYTSNIPCLCFSPDSSQIVASAGTNGLIYFNSRQISINSTDISYNIDGSGNTVKGKSGDYTVLYCLSGTNTIVFDTAVTATVLIVGGGGGGGGVNGGGGGGGGGVGTGTITFAANTTYTITVGAGGKGAIATNPDNYTTSAKNGGNTSIIGGSISEIAYGGGYGGSGRTQLTAGNGGSGGGYGLSGTTVGSATKGSGTLTYYGNIGGTYSGNYAGGGGGAGSAGTSYGSGGVGGGTGYYFNITNNYYGAGGGSGFFNGNGGTQPGVGSYGGSGVGGNGGGWGINGMTAGASNTGSGGGGIGLTTYLTLPNYNGADGGSGIAILAFKKYDVNMDSIINLKAYYNFNTNSIYGTSVGNYASESFSYDATALSTSGFSTTYYKSGNQSLYVNGSNYIDLNTSSTTILPFSTTNGFTVSVWTYSDTNSYTNVLQAFFGFGNGNSSAFHMQFTPNSMFQCWTGNDYIQYTDSNNFTNNQWYHHVVTFTYPNTFKYYLNGAYASSITSTTSTSYSSCRLGWRTDSRDNCYRHYIDEVKIYSKTLSASEISTLYTNT